ncbi:MAG: hypothetical protein RLY16_2199 [Bacteroidota bacterium]|jgi:hypothetical protein
MFLKRFALGTVVGCLFLFFIGWVVNDLFLEDFLQQYAGLTPSAQRSETLTYYALWGNLFAGCVLSYLLTRLRINSSLAAVVVGWMFGFCFKAAALMQVYATTTVYSKTGILVETFVYSVITAVAAMGIYMVVDLANVSAVGDTEMSEIELK